MDPTLASLIVAAVLTSTSDVRAIAHDGEVTWVGTTGGLVRLREGEASRVLGTGEGLPDATVRVVVVAGGELWVGTDRGVAVIAGDRVVRTIATGAPVTAIAVGERTLVGTLSGVGELVEDRMIALDGGPTAVTDVIAIGDRVLASTQGGGVQAWDGTRWTRLRGDALAWDLESDGESVWVATSSGPAIVRGARVAPLRAELPQRDVRAIRRRGDSLVVGTCGAGALVLRGRRAEPVTATGGCVRAIDLDGDRITIASELGITRDGAPLALPPGLPDPDVSSLAVDADGLWVGTFRAGLARIARDGSIARWDERSGLVDDRINRLAIDGEGDLWIATDRGLMERTGGRFQLRGLLDRHVTLVAWTGDRIVAATGDDLHAWDGSTLVALGVGHRAQDVVRTASGATITGTAEGLVIDDAGARRTLVSGARSIPDDWVTAVAVHQGAIAIGTYDAGVALVVSDGDADRVRTIAPGLWVNAGAILSTTVGGRPVLAVGTLDDGLHLWDGRAWSRLGVRDGLPDDDVTAIVGDGAGGLWVATRGGVAHLTTR